MHLCCFSMKIQGIGDRRADILIMTHFYYNELDLYYTIYF